MIDVYVKIKAVCGRCASSAVETSVKARMSDLVTEFYHDDYGRLSTKERHDLFTISRADVEQQLLDEYSWDHVQFHGVCCESCVEDVCKKIP